eukprot:57289_1
MKLLLSTLCWTVFSITKAQTSVFARVPGCTQQLSIELEPADTIVQLARKIINTSSIAVSPNNLVLNSHLFVYNTTTTPVADCGIGAECIVDVKFINIARYKQNGILFPININAQDNIQNLRDAILESPLCPISNECHYLFRIHMNLLVTINGIECRTDQADIIADMFDGGIGLAFTIQFKEFKPHVYSRGFYDNIKSGLALLERELKQQCNDTDAGVLEQQQDDMEDAEVPPNRRLNMLLTRLNTFRGLLTRFRPNNRSKLFRSN